MHPVFADIETRIACGIQRTFENIRLTDGYVVFGGVIDRDVEAIGQDGMTVERRNLLTVLRSDATRFSNGLRLDVDPKTYTVAEIMAMDRASWILDRVDLDDGITVSWWLK